MCIFCELMRKTSKFLYEDPLVFCIEDHYPVTKGHALVITKRHVSSYFELTQDEKKSIDNALIALKDIMDQAYHPDGYNIGMNNGAAAGQTIFHAHVHFIPRYQGDTIRPEGGIRGVIPNKQYYTKKA